MTSLSTIVAFHWPLLHLLPLWTPFRSSLTVFPPTVMSQVSYSSTIMALPGLDPSPLSFPHLLARPRHYTHSRSTSPCLQIIIRQSSRFTGRFRFPLTYPNLQIGRHGVFLSNCSVVTFSNTASTVSHSATHFFSKSCSRIANSTYASPSFLRVVLKRCRYVSSLMS